MDSNPSGRNLTVTTMDKTNTEGQEALEPCEPQTLAKYADLAEKVSDEHLDACIVIMEESLHTGNWGKNRLEILIAERSRRWRIRKGEGRGAK